MIEAETLLAARCGGPAFLVAMRMVGAAAALFVLASGYVFGLRFGGVRRMWHAIVSAVLIFWTLWMTGSRWWPYLLAVSLAWGLGTSVVGIVSFELSERRYRKERADRYADLTSDNG